MVLTNPHMKPILEFKIAAGIPDYEDIYENSDNLSKVTTVYGTQNDAILNCSEFNLNTHMIRTGTIII